MKKINCSESLVVDRIHAPALAKKQAKAATIRSSAGFTLVELSIVLVIIGLIIGGVLTGRQIMENAQITNAINAIQAYQAQFQTYVQNYGAMPGDDINANSRFSGNVTSGNGDGTLEGYFDDSTSTSSTGASTNTSETRLAWADLRAAGLVKQVSGDQTQQPANPFGGIYGFQHGAFGTNGITTNVLCLSEVPADAAEAIDSRLDDGVNNTGTVQAAQTTTAPAAAAAINAAGYVMGQTYTVCVRM